MTVAFAGATQNTWTQATVQHMQELIAPCKTITTLRQTYANSLPQAISQLNSLVADGVKAVVIEPEDGPGQLSSMASSVRQGTALVPILNNPGGTLGTDYQSYAFQDAQAGPAAWAKFFAKTVKSGNLVFLGGTAGATSSEAWFAGLQSALKQYPSLHLVDSQVVSTNWNAGTVTSAVAGLLAKYGRIAGVAMDYGITSTGVITAYQNAHMKLPAIATVASAELNACSWQQTPFPYMSLGGSTFLGALALKKAIAIAEGQAKPAPSNVALPTVVDTSQGMNPPACDSSVSSGEPMTSILPAARLQQAQRAVLGQ